MASFSFSLLYLLKNAYLCLSIKLKVVRIVYNSRKGDIVSLSLFVLQFYYLPQQHFKLLTPVSEQVITCLLFTVSICIFYITIKHLLTDIDHVSRQQIPIPVIYNFSILLVYVSINACSNSSDYDIMLPHIFNKITAAKCLSMQTREAKK